MERKKYVVESRTKFSIVLFIMSALILGWLNCFYKEQELKNIGVEIFNLSLANMILETLKCIDLKVKKIVQVIFWIMLILIECFVIEYFKLGYFKILLVYAIFVIILLFVFHCVLYGIAKNIGDVDKKIFWRNIFTTIRYFAIGVVLSIIFPKNDLNNILKYVLLIFSNSLDLFEEKEKK